MKRFIKIETIRPPFTIIGMFVKCGTGPFPDLVHPFTFDSSSSELIFSVEPLDTGEIAEVKELLVGFCAEQTSKNRPDLAPVLANTVIAMVA